MTDPSAVRFILSNGEHIQVRSAVAAASSEVIAAAIRQSSELKNWITLSGSTLIEFPLTDWDAEVAEYCIYVMHMFVGDMINFDFWLELVKLASYLRMKELPSLCALPISDKIDLAVIIGTAIKYHILDMMIGVRAYLLAGQDTHLRREELRVALSACSTDEIIWLMSAGQAAELIGAYGIASRTSKIGMDSIMMHMPLLNRRGELYVVLKYGTLLSPVSRRLIEHIAADGCEDSDDSTADDATHNYNPTVMCIPEGGQTITGSKTFH